jgi:hypothetical protein
MKAIEVVLIRTRHAKPPAEGPIIISIRENSEGVAVLVADNTNPPRKSNIHNDALPPFWTWFIENPRSIRQGTSQKRPSTEILTDLLVYA